MCLRNHKEAGVASGMTKGRMAGGKFLKVGRRWGWGGEPDHLAFIGMV